MELKELYAIQKQLDDRITDEHQLHHENLIPAKLLALQVELGELANETRCFKFWSKKGPSPKAVILEEYVDCLHFILSIGLDRGFTDVNIKEIGISKEVIDYFQEVFTRIITLQYEFTLESYSKLFSYFLLLGKKLGFTEEEIYEAYLEKNKINHQRQEEGY